MCVCYYLILYTYVENETREERDGEDDGEFCHFDFVENEK